MMFLNYFDSLDRNCLPQHIAIIMDGNGRWAKKRMLPRAFGHKAGVESIREIVKECNNIGIKYLTLYAFSTENWKRPPQEVNALMKLLAHYLKNEADELHKNNVKINTIGDISKLPDSALSELNAAMDKTKYNDGVVMSLALNYGSRNDVKNAIINIINDYDENKFIIDDIDEEFLRKYLSTFSIPDPDLIIRPSGELRLSNFLLWEAAYSELWFSDINWPDFKKEDLHKAIYDYQNRDRRFGDIS